MTTTTASLDIILAQTELSLHADIDRLRMNLPHQCRSLEGVSVSGGLHR